MLSSFLGSFSFLSFLLKPSIFIVQMATLTKRRGKIWPEVHWWCEMKSNYAVQWLARSHDVSSVNLENIHTTDRKFHSQVNIVLCCIRLQFGLKLISNFFPFVITNVGSKNVWQSGVDQCSNEEYLQFIQESIHIGCIKHSTIPSGHVHMPVF